MLVTGFGQRVEGSIDTHWLKHFPNVHESYLLRSKICIALCLHIYHINLVFYGHFDFNAAQHKFNNMQQCEKHKRGSGGGGNRTIRALAGPVCMKNLGHAIFFTRCPPSYLLPVAVTERHPVDESRKYVHTV